MQAAAQDQPGFLEKTRAAALLLVILWAGACPALAASEPRLVRGAQKIAGLNWDESVAVEEGDPGASPCLSAVLRGRFRNPGSSLLQGEHLLAIDDGGATALKEFELRVPLESPETSVKLFAVGAQGDTTVEDVVIRHPAWRAACAEQVGPPRRITLSLGVSSLAYTETASPDLSQFGLTAKAAYDVSLGSTPWSVGVNGYGTALILGSNQPGVNLRFLGLNGRVGYALPSPWKKWKPSIQAGGYYTTTLAPNDAIGFKNMYGPQLFPVLRYGLPGGGSLGTYLKFSPIFDGSRFTFTSRELATGLSWAKPLGGGRSLVTSLDLAQLKVRINDVLDISSTSFSLGCGVTW